MKIINKLKKVFKNPYILIPYLGKKNLLHWIPDKLYLKACFKAKMKRRIDLNNPTTFNEKLQWLKLNDRNPIYTDMVDKYEVRKYIEKTIGREYLIPLIGVYDNFEDIDFRSLPDQFVLKCTHDSGGLVICDDKSKLNIKAARKKINNSLKRNYYHLFREWPYKDVRPRIICEKYMVDESKYELKDYKFFCFNGKPKILYIASNRGTDTRSDFFDMNFNHLPIEQGLKNASKTIKKPKSFNKMVELSKILSKNIPHVRVDFYEVNGIIYFGELTFYHFGGFEEFTPSEYDEIFGRWLDLQQSYSYKKNS